MSASGNTDRPDVQDGAALKLDAKTSKELKAPVARHGRRVPWVVLRAIARMRRRARRALRWANTHRPIAVGLVVALVASLLTGVVFWPDEDKGLGLTPLQKDKSIAAKRVEAKKSAPDTDDKANIDSVDAPVWPQRAKARVELPGKDGKPVKAGLLPIDVKPVKAKGEGGGGEAGPSKVEIETVDPGEVDGVVVRVSRADGGDKAGKVELGIDYSKFANAFGGDWASRLHLVTLPECARSVKKSKKPCAAGKPVVSDNDVEQQRITATVNAAPDGEYTQYALMADNSGNSGDFKATALTPSATWSAGGSSGEFSWDYGMGVPPAAGQLTPELGLEYSSSSVDGRVASTNNQASWVGEGFDLGLGYIERSYTSCSDNTDGAGNPATGDLCWKSDNATMVFGSAGGELVPAGGNLWRPKHDDGSRIEKVTGANNGDNDGEYWKVTSTDGTQYFFGLNRLPGYVDGKNTTNSAWTAPVYGNHTNEPCKQSNFSDSWCMQAWRWNLDYVVDVHGNAYSVYYKTEGNKYGRNMDANAVTDYTRGGTMDRIEYGLRDGNAYTTPLAQVRFETADRCIGSCNRSSTQDWPDVPFDQECTSGPCTSKHSPTFWSTQRLNKVVTETWNTGASKFDPVDSWTFRFSFPDPGDGTTPALWLEGIKRTGHVGTAIELPEVTFGGAQMDNRVEQYDGPPPLKKRRVSSIKTETGSSIGVGYSSKECTRDALPSIEGNNKRCFPAYWTPWGASAPKLDWFHKYVVTNVEEIDLTGGAPIEDTYYDYESNQPAWVKDQSEITLDKYRTHGQWRGYAQVKVTTGEASPGAQQSQVEERYFRGLGGTVTDSDGAQLNDHDAFAGQQYESVTLNGPGGAAVSGETTLPYIRGPLATRSHSGGTVESYQVEVAESRSRVALSGGGYQRTTEQYGYDSEGRITSTSSLGDASQSGDEQCTRTWYAPKNDSDWLQAVPNRTQTTASACSESGGEILAESKAYFDGSDVFGSTPTRALVTKTEELASPGSFVVAGRAEYDIHGRTTKTTDVLGNSTTTEFTPATGGPITEIKTTNAANHVTRSKLEPARGLVTEDIDANNKTMSMEYDALGRLTKGWDTIRPKASNPIPTMEFAYLIRTDGAVAITSKRLNSTGAQISSYQLMDGRLRPRQTQTPAPDGGRIITDTYYDRRGLAWKTNDAWYNDQNPGVDLVAAADNQVPTQTVTEFDGAERPTAQIFRSNLVEKWRTTTTYGGNWVSVDPPEGETATTTYSDALGRVTEKRQYHGGAPSGDYDATTYGYDRADRLDTITDAAGNQWSFDYDLRGRRISSSDPDKGVTTSTYDDAGQLLTTTDARGITLGYTYDALGRSTSVRDGAVDGPKRAEWIYDTVMKGHPTSATRFDGANAYTSAITGYDDGYNVTASKVTIPSAEGQLAGDYTATNTYYQDGSLWDTKYPTMADLTTETIRNEYTPLGLQSKLFSGLDRYASEIVYSKYGEVNRVTIGKVYNRVWRSWYREEGTHRLQRVMSDKELNGSTENLADVRYTYDDAGNVQSIIDSPLNGTVDAQCFDYDYLRRLNQAWTASSGSCADAPTAQNVGGPEAYWQSWTFDVTGNRLSETQHGFGATAGQDVEARYSYPAPGSARPHAVSTVERTGAGLTSQAVAPQDEPETPEATPTPSASPSPSATPRATPSPTKTPSASSSPSASASPTTTPNAQGELAEADEAAGGAGEDPSPSGTPSATPKPSPTKSPNGEDATADAPSGEQAAPSAEATTVPIDEFSYDDAGNTTRRVVGGVTQDLTWDSEGHLASATSNGNTTSFIYDASGQRLIKKDPTGTTLYLGNTELRLDTATSTVKGTRFYTFNGDQVSVRQGSTVTRTLNDHHGTGGIAVNVADMSVKTRKMLPYGSPRSGSTNVAWAGNKGFVGGTVDPELGLTHLNAREYDPVLGKFISVDPIMSAGMPQQFNGYSYALNNPTSFNDSSGLFPMSSIRNGVKAAGRAASKSGTYARARASRSTASARRVNVGAGGGGGARSRLIPCMPVAFTCHESVSQKVTGRAKEELQGIGSDLKDLALSTGDLLTPDEFMHCMFVNLSCPQEDQTGAGILNKKVGPFTLWEIALAAIPGGAEISAGSKALRILAKAKSRIKVKLPASKPRVNISSPKTSTARSSGNAADGPRLQAQLASEEIAGGHAFVKHVVAQGEFPGIRTRPEYATMIEGVILHGERRAAAGGRTAYWRNGVIVIRDPSSWDGGTAFVPDKGYRYFRRNFPRVK
ncbi:MAG: RHS repeat-associated core domain-containing protein [Corynebacteriales bacterium]|nr:RHS repeat-associated core domain-containing protein [Mycobacteriales bacterium]